MLVMRGMAPVFVTKVLPPAPVLSAPSKPRAYTPFIAAPAGNSPVTALCAYSYVVHHVVHTVPPCADQ